MIILSHHQRLLAVQYAREWLGTKYVKNQCCKGAGADCICILFDTLKRLGIDIGTKPQQYCDFFTDDRMVRFMESLGAAPQTPLTIGDAGDIILWTYGPAAHHAGLVTGRDARGQMTVIHSIASYGRVFEHSITPNSEWNWGHRLHSLWKFPVEREADYGTN